MLFRCVFLLILGVYVHQSSATPVFKPLHELGAALGSILPFDIPFMTPKDEPTLDSTSVGERGEPLDNLQQPQDVELHKEEVLNNPDAVHEQITVKSNQKELQEKESLEPSSVDHKSEKETDHEKDEIAIQKPVALVDVLEDLKLFKEDELLKNRPTESLLGETGFNILSLDDPLMIMPPIYKTEQQSFPDDGLIINSFIIEGNLGNGMFEDELLWKPEPYNNFFESMLPSMGFFPDISNLNGFVNAMKKREEDNPSEKDTLEGKTQAIPNVIRHDVFITKEFPEIEIPMESFFPRMFSFNNFFDSMLPIDNDYNAIVDESQFEDYLGHDANKGLHEMFEKRVIEFNPSGEVNQKIILTEESQNDGPVHRTIQKITPFEVEDEKHKMIIDGVTVEKMNPDEGIQYIFPVEKFITKIIPIEEYVPTMGLKDHHIQKVIPMETIYEGPTMEEILKEERKMDSMKYEHVPQFGHEDLPLKDRLLGLGNIYSHLSKADNEWRELPNHEHVQILTNKYDPIPEPHENLARYFSS